MKKSLLKKLHIFSTILKMLMPFITFCGISIILLQLEYTISALITFVISVISLLILFGELKNGILTMEIIIDKDGLTVIAKKDQITIMWNEINYLVFSRQRSIKYVSVFTKEFKELYNTSREYYDNCVVYKYKLNKGHAFFEYREELINEIMKYYSGKMINENMHRKKKR